MNGRAVGVFVDVAAAVIMSILFFLFVPTMVGSFIASYVFLLIAVFMQVVPLFLSGNRQNIIYKIAYFIISAVYLLIQTIISVGAIVWFPDAIWGIAMIGVMLLLSHGVTMIVLYFVSKCGQQNEMYQKEKRQFIELVLKGIKSCKKNSRDAELQKLCDEAIDKISYGNVMSKRELADVESQILSSADRLEQLSADHKNNDCKAECHRLLTLLQERNIKMKVL